MNTKQIREQQKQDIGIDFTVSSRTHAEIGMLVQKLDEKFLGWNLWKAAMGHWCVQIQSRGETIDGETLVKALENAVNYEPLPRIPRPPTVIHSDDCKVEKKGSNWELITPIGNAYLRTKKSAWESAYRLAKKSQIDFEEWYQNYGKIYYEGTEGETYRFVD